MATSKVAIRSMPGRARDADPESVLKDPRAAFRLRVVRAAERLLADDGLEVSMDDIAVAAGVGRRSLFRHFESRDALIAEAMSAAIDGFAETLSTELRSELPLEEWLEAVVFQFHRAVSDAGVGYWQMVAASDRDLPEQLVTLNRRRKKARAAFNAAIAQEAWRRAGGPGDAPTTVNDAVALALSSHVNRSMIDEWRMNVEAVSRLTASMLSVFLRAQISVPPTESRTRDPRRNRTTA